MGAGPRAGSVLSDPRIVAAFATVYLVWGSTYLAIRVVVAGLPPFLSAGLRFLVAGALMLAWAWWRGHRLPTSRRDLLTLALTGTMMLAGANGLVTWAEQWVESNQAALIVATSALWLAWLGTMGTQGQGLSGWTIAGLLSGFLGVAVLVGDGLRFAHAPWTAYAGLQASAFLWSLGSIISKRRPAACAPAMSAALQTLFAALVLGALGLLRGEAEAWTWEPRPLLALAYLVVFGSCIAYGCFFWLVHEVTPAQLGTYAYVNPAVAVLLGWWLLDEHLTGMQIAGTLIILGSVVLVTLTSSPTRKSTAT
jgi:drug/metabolite transporter (DMT)-like permease